MCDNVIVKHSLSALSIVLRLEIFVGVVGSVRSGVHRSGFDRPTA
jgi:hypothetical protein